MIEAISASILELSVVLLVAFIAWGLAYLIIFDTKNYKERYNTCISADMQWINGTCIR
jgi:hypothetical protein